MRKPILILLFGVFAYAGLFSSISGLNMKERKVDAAYTIDTAGINPRVYEFTTISNPKMKCIAIFGNSDKTSAVALQCFPIKPHEDKK